GRQRRRVQVPDATARGTELAELIGAWHVGLGAGQCGLLPQGDHSRRSPAMNLAESCGLRAASAICCQTDSNAATSSTPTNVISTAGSSTCTMVGSADSGRNCVMRKAHIGARLVGVPAVTTWTVMDGAVAAASTSRIASA